MFYYAVLIRHLIGQVIREAASDWSETTPAQIRCYDQDLPTLDYTLKIPLALVLEDG